MSYAEEVMKEINTEAPAVETTVEANPKPVEDPAVETGVESHQIEAEDTNADNIANSDDAVKSKPQPNLSEDKPAEEEPKPAEDKTAEPQPKPDLSQLTKEQKAEHAFARQLAKQKEKHKAEMDAQREELRKEFQQQMDEFKQSLKAEDKPKQREDFDTDDEFIDYLTQRGVDKRMAEIEAANAKAKAEADAKAKQEAEAAEQQRQVAEYFNTNAKRTFGDGYAEFEKTVQKGIANGLADVLDEAPSVRDYIFSNPNGPAVLNEMLNSKESFIRVMRLASNPMDAVIECHELARELSSRKAEPAPAPVPKMPNLGKPGAGGSTRTAPDVFSDDQELIAMVRRMR